MKLRSSLSLLHRSLSRCHVAPSLHPPQPLSLSSAPPLSLHPLSSFRRWSSETATSTESPSLPQGGAEGETVKVVKSDVSKSELAKRVGSVMSHSPDKAMDWINAILIEISEALKRDEKVSLLGFGSFQKKERSYKVNSNHFLSRDEKLSLEEGETSPPPPPPPPPPPLERTVQITLFSQSKVLKEFLNKDGKPVARAPKKVVTTEAVKEEKPKETKVKKTKVSVSKPVGEETVKN